METFFFFEQIHKNTENVKPKNYELNNHIFLMNRQTQKGRGSPPQAKVYLCFSPSIINYDDLV